MPIHVRSPWFKNTSSTWTGRSYPTIEAFPTIWRCQRTEEVPLTPRNHRSNMSALAIKTSLQPHGEAFGQGSSGSELNGAILITIVVRRWLLWLLRSTASAPGPDALEKCILTPPRSFFSSSLGYSIKSSSPNNSNHTKSSVRNTEHIIPRSSIPKSKLHPHLECTSPSWLSASLASPLPQHFQQ